MISNLGRFGRQNMHKTCWRERHTAVQDQLQRIHQHQAATSENETSTAVLLLLACGALECGSCRSRLVVMIGFLFPLWKKGVHRNGSHRDGAFPLVQTMLSGLELFILRRVGQLREVRRI